MPGTLEFLENVLRVRSTYEQPWLHELVPFASFRGKAVLEIGCGAGYDAYEFCRRGAAYTGVDIAPENVARTRSHLELLGFNFDVIEADASSLPFAPQSFDVVYTNGVLHHTADIARCLGEANRVLRTGGELWLIVYHRNSLYFWVTLLLYQHLLRGGFRQMSWQERVSSIEMTASSELPVVNTYSRSELRSLLRGNGFSPRRIWVRKLVPEDLPGGRRLWSRVPQRWLDGIGQRFGWYLVVHAAKSGRVET